jgi:hypothetical protein
MLQGETPQLAGENPVSNFLVLGAILDPKVKAKIWEGKYVDLATLGEQKEPTVAVSVNKDDSLVSLTPAKTPPPANIYQWQRLFATYAAIYAERFPAQAPALFTYSIRILDLHRQYPGTAWRTYDENFRRVRAHCPTLPWHTINWDMAMASIHMPTSQQAQESPPAKQKQPFRNQHVARGTTGQSTSTRRFTPRGHCFRFDQKGACATPSCQFKHTCTICGMGHSRQKCTSQTDQKSSADAELEL